MYIHVKSILKQMQKAQHYNYGLCVDYSNNFPNKIPHPSIDGKWSNKQQIICGISTCIQSNTSQAQMCSDLKIQFISEE